MEDVDYVFPMRKQQSWSFRSEGYINRRVFLRSYPLQWEHPQEEEEEEVELEEATKRDKGLLKLSLKGRFLSAFHLGGGKALLLRKLKDKATFYLFSCNSIIFHKSSTTKLIPSN